MTKLSDRSIPIIGTPPKVLSKRSMWSGLLAVLATETALAAITQALTPETDLALFNGIFALISVSIMLICAPKHNLLVAVRQLSPMQIFLIVAMIVFWLLNGDQTLIETYEKIFVGIHGGLVLFLASLRLNNRRGK